MSEGAGFDRRIVFSIVAQQFLPTLSLKKDAPALAAPRSSQQNRGFLRREDYYTEPEVATKKARKTRFFIGEMRFHREWRVWSRGFLAARVRFFVCPNQGTLVNVLLTIH